MNYITPKMDLMGWVKTHAKTKCNAESGVFLRYESRVGLYQVGVELRVGMGFYMHQPPPLKHLLSNPQHDLLHKEHCHHINLYTLSTILPSTLTGPSP